MIFRRFHFSFSIRADPPAFLPTSDDVTTIYSHIGPTIRSCLSLIKISAFAAMPLFEPVI
jgi:hypothetical protein